MKTLLFLLILAVVLAGCNGCKDKTLPHRPVNAELLPFVDFHEGDYWIYKDLLTGEEDSLVVTSRRNFIEEVNQWYTEDVIEVNGRIYTAGVVDSPQFYFLYRLESYNGSVSIDTLFPDVNLQSKWYLKIPSDLKRGGANYFNNLTVQSVNYDSVYEQVYYDSAKVYLKSGIGLLKGNIHRGTWNWKDYELVRKSH